MKPLLLTMALLLVSCVSDNEFNSKVDMPENWSESSIESVNPENLIGWWKKFDDPVLTELVDVALKNNPGREVALTNIQSARGILRSTKSSLYPQVNAFGSGGKADNGFVDPFEFYEAGFDVSFEIDLFGKIKDRVDAEKHRLDSLNAQYHDVSLSLIAEVSRVYINVQSSRIQKNFIAKNLELQKETLKLIRSQINVGEGRQIDVERAENIVNNTQSRLYALERLANAYLLQLVSLTGTLPSDLKNKITTTSKVPGADLKPVLLSPLTALALRPDIKAAESNLNAQTAIKQSVSKEVLPNISLSGFWGIAEGTLKDSTYIWQGALNSTMNLIDFGKIQGRIDSAEAIEIQAFQIYRKTVLNAIKEVETSISDYTKINSERNFLLKARINANKAYQYSLELYKEGEISFLDVLDSQRSLIDADSSLIASESAQAKSLVRIYKSLGIY